MALFQIRNNSLADIDRDGTGLPPIKSVLANNLHPVTSAAIKSYVDNKIITKSFSGRVDGISNNSWKDVDIPIGISGYTPLGIISFSKGMHLVLPYNISISGNNAHFGWTSIGQSYADFSFTVLYIKA